MKKILLGLIIALSISTFSYAGDQNFIYLRYGSASVAWLIYQRSLTPDFGSPVFTVGAAPNPHSDYREYFVGGGFNFNGDHIGIMPTLLYADTTDGDFLEYWISPWLNSDRWSFNSFIGGYAALGSGSPQFFIDPATLVYKPCKLVGLGGSYSMVKIQGVDSTHSLGPAVQVAIPKGIILLDYLVGVSNIDNEFRVTVQVAF